MLARLTPSLLTAALVLAAIPALAAAPDAKFAMQAAQGGMAEVQMGQLALSKSRNAVVRAFAQKMVTDHTANNAKLAAIMRSEGMSVPTTVDPASRAMMTKLQGLSGAAFNSAYMSGQVRGHQQMQILMQSEANGGKDARLVAYAKTTLTAVNQHLNMAKADLAKLRSGGSMGGSMSGGSMSGGSTSGGMTPSGTTTSMPTTRTSTAPSTMPGGSMGSPMPGSVTSPMPGPGTTAMPTSSMAPSGSTSGSGSTSASPSPAPRPT
jgi:putative membrane protein